MNGCESNKTNFRSFTQNLKKNAFQKINKTLNFEKQVHFYECLKIIAQQMIEIKTNQNQDTEYNFFLSKWTQVIHPRFFPFVFLFAGKEKTTTLKLIFYSFNRKFSEEKE